MIPAKLCKIVLLTILFLGIEMKLFSQPSGKHNPIIFIEETFGGAFGGAGGFGLSFGVNYQHKKSLFTARYVGTVRFGVDVIDPWVPLPYINVRHTMGEAALLYGVRIIEQNKGYSFSLGASYSGFDQYYNRAGYNEKQYQYFGVPFEANIKWFKKEKQRFKIYTIFPVGKPTAFGGSIGFKLFGNISKQSYAGVGLSAGLGLHKVYD